MKVLVTGGAGFIGHNVVKQLEDDGHEVAILDYCKNDTLLIDERLALVKAKLFKSDIATVIARTHTSIFEPEVIVHCASAPNAAAVTEDPEAASKSMIIGLENMLLAAGRFGVKRFVYISSSMVYGNFSTPPKEWHTTSPTSLYGSFKLAGEHMVKLYAEKYGFEYSIIRPSAVYGPMDNDNRVIGKFFEAALKGDDLHVYGKAERLDFTYVTDIATGIVLAATSDNAGEVFNMTYGYAREIKQAAKLVLEITGSNSKIQTLPKGAAPTRGSLDISRARDVLGYHPKIMLEVGLQTYYDYLTHTI